MATDRYTRIESLDKQAYSPEAPVLFDKGALLVDNVKKINVLQLQFENISNKNIIELEIKITCRDKHGALLGDVIHIYFGSDMVPNETFGSNVGITVENSAARIFDFDIERVVFGDGSILQNHIPLDKHFDRRPIFQMDNFNVVSNYLAEEHISTYNGCIPEFKEYGWRCICGRINKPASEECRVCKAPKKVLENVIFGDAIEKKAMQLEKHREKRNKTLHMILKIAIPIVIIALCLLIFGMYQHQKSDEYIKSTGMKQEK